VSYHLGIDIGNTSVAVAVANATTVEVFRSSDHAVVMPATVYLRADGVLAAEQAASSPGGRGVDRLGSGFMVGWVILHRW
jgi:molecular chaperone DnaK (HSP70)